MPAQVRSRRQKTIAINAFNQKLSEPLGRGMIYREMGLRLYGTFTYGAAGNNVPATLGRGDEWSLLTRIDIVANGNDNIRTFTGPQLRFMNRLFFGSVPRPSLQLGDGATAAPAFDSTLIIPFWMPLSIKPMDTAFDSTKISDMRIELQIGAATDINSASGPTGVTASIDVFSVECFGIEGMFSDMRIYTLQQVVAGANPQLQVILPVTSLYRGFFINAANGSANTSTDLPNAITNVKLISGTTTFRDAPWRLLQDWQRQRLGWAREVVPNAAQSVAISNANGVYMRMCKSALADEDAWGFMDLVQDGYLAESTDSVGFAEIYLELAIAQACTLTIMPVQVFPRRKMVSPQLAA